jgi:hypothetical protein
MADVFYKAVLAGKPLGQALTLGRQALQSIKALDWADYIHYGNHDFTLKVNVNGHAGS